MGTTIYYLGRVIKLGKLTSDMVIEAILKPKTAYWWKNGWSFFDAQVFETDGVKYICAKLSKFNPEGEVVIADPGSRQEIVQAEPNLRIASSFFIYIPSVSGIAFSKVANQIEEFHFIHRFCQIIDETHLRFFVECQIEPIADLHSFAEKLRSLDGIHKISAQVYPPNPLFGPLWGPLKDYLKTRRAEKMMVREDSSTNEPLRTDLPNLVTKVASQDTGEKFVPAADVPIGDAAILMAADGYGTGHVKGFRRGESVTIRTSETIKNFSLHSEHTPHELFKEAYAVFKQIEKDRHMEH